MRDDSGLPSEVERQAVNDAEEIRNYLAGPTGEIILAAIANQVDALIGAMASKEAKIDPVAAAGGVQALYDLVRHLGARIANGERVIAAMRQRTAKATQSPPRRFQGATDAI